MTVDQTDRAVERYDTLARRDDLAGVIGHGRWVRRTRPFAHVVAREVFTPDFYGRLHEQVVGLLGDSSTFQANMGRYDAVSSPLQAHRDGPLGIFLSRGWHDLMAGVCGVEATGDVIGTVHHHQPGGKSGWPHQDLSPAWFGGPPPAPDEVRLPDDRVDYQHGTRPDGVDARALVRGVALLFYLGNPEWKPGDGGETALFDSFSGARRGPAAVVPPINNSLVLFECTPFSWHSFMSNRTPRTSVVMWAHRPKSEAVARWGEQSIDYW